MLSFKSGEQGIRREYMGLFVNHHYEGSFENEALENEDWSTKHPKLENEAPYLENEAPKTRKRRPLNLENEDP